MQLGTSKCSECWIEIIPSILPFVFFASLLTASDLNHSESIFLSVPAEICRHAKSFRMEKWCKRRDRWGIAQPPRDLYYLNLYSMIYLKTHTQEIWPDWSTTSSHIVWGIYCHTFPAMCDISNVCDRLQWFERWLASNVGAVPWCTMHSTRYSYSLI